MSAIIILTWSELNKVFAFQALPPSDIKFVPLKQVKIYSPKLFWCFSWLGMTKHPGSCCLQTKEYTAKELMDFYKVRTFPNSQNTLFFFSFLECSKKVTYPVRWSRLRSNWRGECGLLWVPKTPQGIFCLFLVGLRSFHNMLIWKSWFHFQIDL